MTTEATSKWVLVTGAGGFIGSRLVEMLLAAGRRVRALARYNGKGSWGHLAGIEPPRADQLEVRLGDVTDPFQVRDLVQGCDLVYHLAALIGIPYSYQAPASYVAVNVCGTLNVLEACRQANLRRVIVASTSEVYGTARFTPITEDHPLQGQSPYAASKIAADKLAESFFCSFDLPVVTLRPFNTYGPRQSARAVIPAVLTQALAGATEIHLGNREPRRDLTFVDDTARAFMLAGTAPGVEGQVIHFGQGEAFSVAEIAQRCLDAAGSKARIALTAERQRPEKSEVGLLLCDPTQARRKLGWKPEVSLAEGLRRTTEYVRSHLGQYQAGGYVV
jgi:NAD dependent epimerase/dehydratase